MQRMQIDNKNKVKVYAAPSGAVLQKDYLLKVRAVGDEEWIIVPVYRVKVDMHDVRTASMAYFDFEGEAEVEVSGPFYIAEALVRPLSRNISVENDTKKIRFRIDRPENLSVELNKNRYHNLHLFAGKIEEPTNDYVKIEGDTKKANFISENVFLTEEFAKKRKLWLTAGIYYVTECVMRIPSDTEIYTDGGVVIIGAFICENAENIKIWGRGIFYQAGFERFSAVNGIRISHSTNVCVSGVMFVNPAHYTVFLGESRDVVIENIKSFSCEGWSDGIDMMSCKNVHIKGGFLRTSDDCIAIYGSRWDNRGDTTDVVVDGAALWADVAHPTMIGTHGNYAENGDRIENIVFKNIDILEHNEPQAGYLGCLTINAGDKNTVENVTYENINIEPFLHGKVIDVQVRWNKDYNPAPGKLIKGITFKNINYLGDGEVTSVINGYDESLMVKDITISNYVRGTRVCSSFEDANIKVGRYSENVVLG